MGLSEWKLDGEERAELLELTKELIRIPSAAKDGNDIYEFAFAWLKKRGLSPSFQSISSPYLEYEDHTNVYLRLGEGREGEPHVMVNGHLDTVSARGGWYHPRFEGVEEDGRIFGLGAADMKGGCAAAMYSTLALSRKLDGFPGRLFLSLVFGEEAPFSLGCDTLLREHDLSDYDLIIVAEPSPLLAIHDFCSTHGKIHATEFPVPIVGAEGRVLFELEFFGHSSHASHPSQGVNALHDAAKVISALAEFNVFSNIRMGRGHYAVINIEGGDQTFTVPGYSRTLINRQLTLGETEKTVTREMKALIKSLRLRSKVKVAKRFSPAPELEYRPYLFFKSEYIDRFLSLLPPSGMKNGKRCRFTTSSVGDFNLLGSRTGVPTLVFGPGGGNIHAPDEYVNGSEVIATAEYLMRFYREVFS